MKKHLNIKYVDVEQGGVFKNTSMSVRKNRKDLILEALSENYDVEFSDNPDLIFSWYPIGKLKGTDYYKYNCKKCSWLLESEFPDFDSFDYVVSSYHNLKYYDRHLFIPYSIMGSDNFTTDLNYELALTKHQHINKSLTERSFCSFTVSNSLQADKERADFFDLLSSYKKVDSGGEYKNNIGFRVKDKLAFDSYHKFSIAFENMKGSYITEKLDAAFAGKTIPIYWGNPYVGEVYNTKAFINCYEFTSFEEVVKKVIELDNDDEKYLRMLREPAFIDGKSIDFYKKELADFFVKVVEGGGNTFQHLYYRAFAAC